MNGRDPSGLKLWQVQYWADRSIQGDWLNRSASTTMGVLAAMVPDVITLDGRFAIGTANAVTPLLAIRCFKDHGFACVPLLRKEFPQKV